MPSLRAVSFKDLRHWSDAVELRAVERVDVRLLEYAGQPTLVASRVTDKS
jgi:hypothetical protein